jgi:hypothetical protein
MLSNTAMFKNKFVYAFTLALALTTALTGCGGKQEFDRKGWDDGDGIEFPNRAGMLDDLLANHNPKGKTYKQVLRQLRYPQRNSYTDKSFEYEIVRKMDGLDTVYAKSLILYLNKDSVVSDVKVIEKDNKEKLNLKHKEQNKKK